VVRHFRARAYGVMVGAVALIILVAAAAGLGICLVAFVVIGLVLWKEQVASALGSIADRWRPGSCGRSARARSPPSNQR
jgi:hypothetical protein